MVVCSHRASQVQAEECVTDVKMLLQWKFILPTINVVAAVCMWLYIPFQFEKESTRVFNVERARHGKPAKAPFGGHPAMVPEMFDMYFPPPIGRVLYSSNLPAYVLSNKAVLLAHYRPIPGWRFIWSVRGRNGVTLGEVTYDVSIGEVTFVVVLLFVWYWVGSKIDTFTRHGEATTRTKRKRFHIAEMPIALGLGVLLFRECLHFLLAPGCSPPERQIMTFGLIWPILFLGYFCYMLFDRLRTSRVLSNANL